MASDSEEINEVLIDISTIENPVTEEAALEEAISHLAQNGIPVVKFSRAGVNKLYMTVSAYLKEIRNLTVIKDPELLDGLLEAAVASQVCGMPRNFDEATLLRVARWAKRGEGAEKVADTQHRLKLVKRAGDSATPEAVALAQLLDQQLQDMGAEKKAERQLREAAISKYQRKIDRERRKLDANLVAIENKYHPADTYEVPAKEVISRRCWEKYEEHCTRQGKTPALWSNILAAKIEADYSAQVFAEHRQQFVQNRTVKRRLLEWGRRKISELTSADDRRRAQSFRRLLGSAGGIAAVPSTVEREEEAPAESPRGPSPAPGDVSREPTPERSASPEDAPGEEDVWRQASPPPKKKRGRPVGKASTSEVQPEDHPAKKSRKSRRRRDPSSEE